MKEESVKEMELDFEAFKKISRRRFGVHFQFKKGMIDPQHRKGYRDDIMYHVTFKKQIAPSDYSPINYIEVFRNVSVRTQKNSDGKNIHLCIHTPLDDIHIHYIDEMSDLQKKIKKDIIANGFIEPNDIDACISEFDNYVDKEMNRNIEEFMHDNSKLVSRDKFIKEVKEEKEKIIMGRKKEQQIKSNNEWMGTK